MGFVIPSNQLEKDSNGIWTSNKKRKLSYPSDGNLEYFKLEENSFWFQHRNDCIIATLKRFPPSGTIVDIGGGNGFVTRRMLDEGFDAILLEPGYMGAHNAKNERNIPEVICSTFEDAGFFPDSLDAITIFDILEHIEDDQAMVDQAQKVLKTGGVIYATVPAHNWLWSASDISGKHFRRYSKEQFLALFRSKFDIIYFTYFFKFLILPIFLFRTLPYKLGLAKERNLLNSKFEHGLNAGIAEKTLKTLLSSEPDSISNRRQILIGASCLCVTKKK